MSEPTQVQAHAHVVRFARVSSHYPARVAEVYDGDLPRAMADEPETVAAKVAAWEHGHGLEPQDWPAIGRAEGADGVDPGPITA
jgi:hypothetical protein